MPEDALERVRRANAAVTRAQLALAATVEEAHTAGHSWARIGEVLGVSRQAAFKRFGTARDPRTGDALAPTKLAGVEAIAESVFLSLDAGDYEAIRPLLPDDIALVLNRAVLLDMWARAVADTGNLRRCDVIGLQAADGTELAVNSAAQPLGTVVVVLRLECAAGEWQGRVGLDAEHRVVGIWVSPPATMAP